MAWERQIHPLGEQAQGLYERAALLYPSAASLFRLPQDGNAFAEALFNEPPVRYELAEALSHDALDRSEAVEALRKTHARRRELAPSREPLSQVLCECVEVTGRFDGDPCPSAADRCA
jgi:hypothetical protein